MQESFKIPNIAIIIKKPVLINKACVTQVRNIFLVKIKIKYFIASLYITNLI